MVIMQRWHIWNKLCVTSLYIYLAARYLEIFFLNKNLAQQHIYFVYIFLSVQLFIVAAVYMRWWVGKPVCAFINKTRNWTDRRERQPPYIGYFYITISLARTESYERISLAQSFFKDPNSWGFFTKLKFCKKTIFFLIFTSHVRETPYTKWMDDGYIFYYNRGLKGENFAIAISIARGRVWEQSVLNRENRSVCVCVRAAAWRHIVAEQLNPQRDRLRGGIRERGLPMMLRPAYRARDISSSVA